MEQTQSVQTTEKPVQLQQKEAVYQLALAAVGGAAPEGATLRSLVTKEVRKTIRTQLFDGIRNGSIEFKPVKTDGELKKYCSSVINNWLNKDKRFN